MDVLQRFAEIVSAVQPLGNETLERNLKALQSEVVGILDSHRQFEARSAQLQQHLAHTLATLTKGAYDCHQFAVLYVDDEEKSLKCFLREYGRTFRILTAANARDGLKMVNHADNKIGVVL